VADTDGDGLDDQYEVDHGSDPLDADSVSFDVREGLVAQYELDGDATDSHGSYDGAITGTVTPTAGQIGTAMAFDGASRIDLPDTLSDRLNGSTELTIVAWVNASTVPVDAAVIGSREDGGDSGTGIRFDSSGYRGGEPAVLKFNVEAEGVPYAPHESEANVQTNETQLVVLRWSAGEYPEALTGTPGAVSELARTYTHPEGPTTGGLVVPANEANSHFMIGYGLNRDYWDGWIDEVRFYDRALTDEEIDAYSQYDGTE
jgi:hypothetical protein